MAMVLVTTTNTKKRYKEKKAEIDGLHPGFLLKRFDTEAEFARFQEEILSSPALCGFEGFLDEDFDIAFDTDTDAKGKGNDKNQTNHAIHEDEYVAKGNGVVDGGPEGIFLSMQNVQSQWKPNEPAVTHRFTTTEVGYYFLFYQICLFDQNTNNRPAHEKFLFREVRSTFHLDFEYKNVDLMGNLSYLTAGEMPLPHMYLYFSVSYALMLFLWVRSLKTDDSHPIGAKPTVFAIHHLMSMVLALKLLTVFFESVRYHFIRVNGHAEIWSFVYYVLNFVKGTFLFTVILLIGSGWSFFKPFLTTKERRVVIFVFILQVIDNIAVVALTHETMGERLYNDWTAVLHLVDIISCCAILVPIVWQVNMLEQSLEGEQAVQESADEQGTNDGGEIVEGSFDADEQTRLQARLLLFRSFYLIVVAYIYFTRIVVYLFASSLSYNHTWLRYLVAELGTLTFYFMIGIKFRPRVENEYSSVNKNEDDGFGDERESVELGIMTKAKK